MHIFLSKMFPLLRLFPNAQSVQKTAHVHCAIHSLSALSAVLSPRVLNSTLKREAGAI